MIEKNRKLIFIYYNLYRINNIDKIKILLHNYNYIYTSKKIKYVNNFRLANINNLQYFNNRFQYSIIYILIKKFFFILITKIKYKI